MNDWVGLVVGVTAILAFLGSGTAFVVSGRQKGRTSSLKDTVDDLRGDVQDRDHRIEFLEAENESKGEQITQLKAQVQVLESLKLGEAYFKAIQEQVAAHSTTVLTNHERFATEIGVLRNQNRDIIRLLAGGRHHE